MVGGSGGSSNRCQANKPRREIKENSSDSEVDKQEVEMDGHDSETSQDLQTTLMILVSATR